MLIEKDTTRDRWCQFAFLHVCFRQRIPAGFRIVSTENSGVRGLDDVFSRFHSCDNGGITVPHVDMTRGIR